MSKYKNGYQNLTLLDRKTNDTSLLGFVDRMLIKFDSWQAKRSTEIAMLFVCFVLAPAYILFHIVSFIVRSI